MIEKVRQLIQCDRRMTVVELEQEVGMSHGSIHAILSDDLKMRRVSAKFVPRQLTTDQMECRMMVAGDLLRKVRKTRRFSQRLSRVTSHGCSPTTQRRRCIQQSGTHRRLPDQRNHASSNPKKK